MILQQKVPEMNVNRLVTKGPRKAYSLPIEIYSKSS